jgi:hypothetical protein
VQHFVQGEERAQRILFPSSLDDYVTEENPVRVVEAFVDGLDLDKLGFAGVNSAATGHPCFFAVSLSWYASYFPL